MCPSNPEPLTQDLCVRDISKRTLSKLKKVHDFRSVDDSTTNHLCTASLAVDSVPGTVSAARAQVLCVECVDIMLQVTAHTPDKWLKTSFVDN